MEKRVYGVYLMERNRDRYRKLALFCGRKDASAFAKAYFKKQYNSECEVRFQLKGDTILRDSRGNCINVVEEILDPPFLLNKEFSREIFLVDVHGPDGASNHFQFRSLEDAMEFAEDQRVPDAEWNVTQCASTMYEWSTADGGRRVELRTLFV